MSTTLLFVVLALSLPAAAAPITLRAGGPAYGAALAGRWSRDFQSAHHDAQVVYAELSPEEALRAAAAARLDLALVDQVPESSDLVAIPVAVSAVAAVYNLTVAGDLKLDAPALRGIFSGTIVRWRDPAITALNPGVTIPELPIRVVLPPGDSSLRLLREFIGVANLAGTRLASDAAAAAAVSAAEGTISCLDAAFARRSALFVAALRNHDGSFTLPSARNTSHAAVGVKLPPDLRASIVDPRGVEAYPLSAFLYAALPAHPADSARAQAVLEFLRWAVHEGQSAVLPVGYAPLPGFVVLLIDDRLRRLPWWARSR